MLLANNGSRSVLRLVVKWWPPSARLGREISAHKSAYSTDNTNKFLFDESDLTEEFVRGWGPGGQKINKTSNCVLLHHNPTGLFVKCQDSRILEENRKIARQRLNQKLDIYYNGDESETVQMERKANAREQQKYLRSKRRLATKLEFKEREGLSKKSHGPMDPADECQDPLGKSR
ncbi:unnamed protein product [Calicophoron daubneyi]|uniref:Prokaryotic-type class I peptide chain release factors domain-containing protein n=1 Tax=Calicophoron daubneyi TaxID=300641 RepID=A0AAV2TMU4_CALDB